MTVRCCCLKTSAWWSEARRQLHAARSHRCATYGCSTCGERNALPTNKTFTTYIADDQVTIKRDEISDHVRFGPWVAQVRQHFCARIQSVVKPTSAPHLLTTMGPNFSAA